jgi:hypothetical protein
VGKDTVTEEFLVSSPVQLKVKVKCEGQMRKPLPLETWKGRVQGFWGIVAFVGGWLWCSVSPSSP